MAGKNLLFSTSGSGEKGDSLDAAVEELIEVPESMPQAQRDKVLEWADAYVKPADEVSREYK